MFPALWYKFNIIWYKWFIKGSLWFSSDLTNPGYLAEVQIMNCCCLYCAENLAVSDRLQLKLAICYSEGDHCRDRTLRIHDSPPSCLNCWTKVDHACASHWSWHSWVVLKQRIPAASQHISDIIAFENNSYAYCSK